MTIAWVLVASLGASLVVRLGWPMDPLQRLVNAPTISWPRWLSPRASALSARTRAIAAAGVALTAMLAVNRPLPLVLALGLAVAGAVFWALGKVETGGAAAVRAELVADLPAALDVLAACVTSGMPLRSATGAVASAVGGQLGARLASVASRTAAGFSDSDAWAALKDDEVLGPLARDLTRAADAGTAIAAMVGRHAESARSAAYAAALARAKAVGVRTIIPVSVCYLPAFFLLGVVPVIAGVLTSLLR